MAILVLSLVGALACGPPARPGTPPEHVLVITMERVRGDHMSFLGYERPTTGLLRLDQPTVLDLDFLAEKGVVFAHAFAPSSDDEFSMATLMGGALPAPRADGAPELRLTPGLSTLAGEFEAAGFRSSGFFNRASIDDHNASAVGFGQGFGHAEFLASDVEVLTAAVEWLRVEAEREEPLFTWIHLAGIDVPFEGGAHGDQFSVRDYTGPVRESAEFFSDLASGRVQLDATDRRRLVDLYDGRLIRATELLNSFFFLYKNDLGGGRLWDQTLFVVTGTSGCELAEHGGGVATRDSLVDEGLHVPLFLSHPRSMTGERILAPIVELVDVTATLRDWFDLESLGDPVGRSLLRLTDSYIEREFPRYPALSLRHEQGRITGSTIRGEHWRLTRDRGRWKLFDLEVDPGARHDLSELDPDRLAESRRELEARRKSLGLAEDSH